MNKLQKKAWVDLIVCAVIVVAAGAGFSLLIRLNAKGIVNLLIVVIAGGVAGLFSGLSEIKTIKRNLDEREKLIYQKACNWSAFIFKVFFACACVVPFYLLGARQSIPVYMLPFLLLLGIFISQLVHSGVILLQIARESKDE